MNEDRKVATLRLMHEAHEELLELAGNGVSYTYLDEYNELIGSLLAKAVHAVHDPTLRQRFIDASEKVALADLLVKTPGLEAYRTLHVSVGAPDVGGFSTCSVLVKERLWMFRLNIGTESDADSQHAKIVEAALASVRSFSGLPPEPREVLSPSVRIASPSLQVVSVAKEVLGAVSGSLDSLMEDMKPSAVADAAPNFCFWSSVRVDVPAAVLRYLALKILGSEPPHMWVAPEFQTLQGPKVAFKASDMEK